MKGTASIPEEAIQTGNIRYVKNRDYYSAMGLKAIVYNLMLTSNMESGEKTRR